MTRSIPLLAATLAAALVAGCATPGGGPDARAPTPVPAASEVDVARLGTACTQVHSYFASPAEAFAAYVPDGFSLATKDGGLLVDVRVEATRCAEATEVWVELPVVPPEALAATVVPEAIHTVPVVAYAAPRELVESYRSVLPDQAFDAEISLAATAGGRYSLAVTTDRESYAWEGALDLGEGAFEAETVARWIPHDDHLAGHYLRLSSESTSVGFGPVTMLYQGSGGAPPVASGIAHVVEGMTLTESFVVGP